MAVNVLDSVQTIFSTFLMDNDPGNLGLLVHHRIRAVSMRGWVEDQNKSSDAKKTG